MGAAPADEAIFERLPNSRQNPLLTVGTFAKYGQRRFRWAISAKSFAKWIEPRIEAKLIRPAYRHNDTLYLSTYQVWQINRLSEEDLEAGAPAIFSDFEVLLKLMVRIQDYYLPEIRSNQRFGEDRDYRGLAAVGGTYFCTRTQYLLSYVREWRRARIESGIFDPATVASEAGLDSAALERWRRHLLACAKGIDPLWDWREIIKYVRYGRRQRLRFEALLAQDYYEMVDMLMLFLADLNSGPDLGDPPDRADAALRDRAPRIPDRKVDRYGESHSRPYAMLEFLSNQYDLNPTPRAIVLTEGEEWKAIKKLYMYRGYDPELLGIDFRSISGEGNFSLANWQAFIEYMHERQILSLKNALSDQLKVAVDKPRLAVDLVNDLVSQRQERPNVKTLRPIEKFVERSGHLIMLNHLPADEEMRRLNIKTGLLG